MKKLFAQYLFPRFVMDFSTFYPPLMILGFFAAQLKLDSAFMLGLVANYLMLVFAFMINDIEDREDDAKNKYKKLSILNHLKLNLGIYNEENAKTDGSYKRFLNPFAHAIWTPTFGYFVLLISAILSILLSYFAGGWLVTLVAMTNLGFGVLYSWKRLRLKALPIIDVLSHAYLLAGAQILYFLAYPNANIDIGSILILLGATLYAIAGDLFNEYRDFASDQEAGLRNTASILGENLTSLLAKLSALVSVTIVMLGILLNFR